MNYDKENEQEMPAADKEKKEESIHVHDPFEKGNDKEAYAASLHNLSAAFITLKQYVTLVFDGVLSISEKSHNPA